MDSTMQDKEQHKKSDNDVAISDQSNESKLARKRKRRKASEIDRSYRCFVINCHKYYGSENALKMHIKLKHPEFVNEVPKTFVRDRSGSSPTGTREPSPTPINTTINTTTVNSSSSSEIGSLNSSNNSLNIFSPRGQPMNVYPNPNFVNQNSNPNPPQLFHSQSHPQLPSQYSNPVQSTLSSNRSASLPVYITQQSDQMMRNSVTPVRSMSVTSISPSSSPSRSADQILSSLKFGGAVGGAEQSRFSATQLMDNNNTPPNSSILTSSLSSLSALSISALSTPSATSSSPSQINWTSNNSNSNNNNNVNNSTPIKSNGFSTSALLSNTTSSAATNSNMNNTAIRLPSSMEPSSPTTSPRTSSSPSSSLTSSSSSISIKKLLIDPNSRTLPIPSPSPTPFNIYHSSNNRSMEDFLVSPTQLQQQTQTNQQNSVQVQNQVPTSTLTQTLQSTSQTQQQIQQQQLTIQTQQQQLTQQQIQNSQLQQQLQLQQQQLAQQQLQQQYFNNSTSSYLFPTNSYYNFAQSTAFPSPTRPLVRAE